MLLKNQAWLQTSKNSQNKVLERLLQKKSDAHKMLQLTIRKNMQIELVFNQLKAKHLKNRRSDFF